jgi:hypothetical protein
MRETKKSSRLALVIERALKPLLRSIRRAIQYTLQPFVKFITWVAEQLRSDCVNDYGVHAMGP